MSACVDVCYLCNDKVMNLGLIQPIWDLIGIWSGVSAVIPSDIKRGIMQNVQYAALMK